MILSQVSKNIVLNQSLGKRKKSNRKVARLIQIKRGYSVSHQTILRARKRDEQKPYIVLKKPLKSEKNKEDRMWFFKLFL